MKKYLKTILIVWTLFILWRISQIVFDVFYSTNQKSYLGIWHGSRTQSIISWGYEEQHINAFTTSTPIPYVTSHIGKFQDQCHYWQGNCIWLFGQQWLASFRWINAIQYIAQEVDTSQPSDITNRFANLNDINPTRYYPYILLQYLGNPSQSEKTNQTQIARENTIRLWEKGIQYHCNMQMIEKIDKLSYTGFLQALDEKNPEYRYPCTSWWELAHTMAFNYFYYLWDSKKSILYYKVASFHDDVPAITSSMPILIEGKEWNNKTSAYLWYDQFNNAMTKYKNKENLNPDEISNLESSMDKSLQKMVSEYSLYLLNQASKKAKDDGKLETCYTTQPCLQPYIANILNSLANQCQHNSIDCQIISYWKERKRIDNKGNLSYPWDLQYKWNNEKNNREIKAF